MTENKPKKRKWLKRILLALFLIIVGLGVTYFVLPNEKKRKLYQDLGIEDSEFISASDFESFISIRKVTSRKALVGDKWVIKGQIFNTHESKTLSKVELRFNFSDGSENVEIETQVSPQNGIGKSFKEKVEGHGKADFLSVDVVNAE
ncbi:hypothetical protein K6119_03400 [Paracrocinitomix mangrovi]|uniref:hypothetical protein n=1 Tax=Paracrocinitomix mangrovi TaxID=2862509 RepID=UPI001C8DFCE8|nr:hypothetical protein [Paracrocinitomix mangrovi]UKN02561.1 hypothetical protein K6119_03400 [Paracrocinitomix mangrovi]